jgi:hypothetical protein
MNNKNPLVSVIVSSYTSSGFGIETLGSVKLQTCLYLWLLIAEDCSTDKTVKN